MDMFRTARILILVGVASAAPLCALRPQADTSARLGGNAISAYNGRPLALVMIAVPTAGKSVVTASTGRFLLTALEPARRIGHHGLPRGGYRDHHQRKRAAVVGGDGVAAETRRRVGLRAERTQRSGGSDTDKNQYSSCSEHVHTSGGSLQSHRFPWFGRYHHGRAIR